MVTAFATSARALGLDMLSRMSNPENRRFQMDQERQVMHRLGMGLPDVVGMDDNDDLHYAAHTIRRYFGDELCMAPMPEFMGDTPRFLRTQGSRAPYRTEPWQLARRLGEIAVSDSQITCIVSSKLHLLQELLHLSSVDIRFLTLAYAVGGQYQRTDSLASSIATALAHIAVHDDGQKNRAIAVLLGVPVEDVATMLTPPSRLHALRFVESIHTTGKPSLRELFVLTAGFVDILESTYPSHNALLQAILAPEHAPHLVNDEAVPIGYLYDEFPKEVAEAFECAVLERPLRAHHIYALVRWYTGASPALPSRYSQLVGRIGVQAVRDAIKRAAFDGCRANVPLDSPALMRALHASAGLLEANTSP